MPVPKILASIKPAYPHLVHYSQPGDPMFSLPPFSPPEIGPALSDEPTRIVSAEEDKEWLATLGRASDGNN